MYLWDLKRTNNNKPELNFKIIILLEFNSDYGGVDIKKQ